MSAYSDVRIREATLADVDAIVAGRAPDVTAGPADPRIAAYMRGEHHPQHARPPRVVYVAVDCSRSVGYIAGHLTTRFACDGEVQWLYVAQGARHAGVATALLRRLMDWFVAHGAARVCVDVAPHNAAARRLYARAGAVALNRAWMVWEDVAMSRDTAAR